MSVLHTVTRHVTTINGKKKYDNCISPQVKCSTSEALSMDHTAFYTANTPCRLYRVVRQRGPRQNEPLQHLLSADEVYYSFIDPVRVKG